MVNYALQVKIRHKTLGFHLHDFTYDFNFINILTSVINSKLEFKIFLENFQFKNIILNAQMEVNSPTFIKFKFKETILDNKYILIKIKII